MSLIDRAFVVDLGFNGRVVKKMPKDGSVLWRIMQRSNPSTGRTLAAAALLLQPVLVDESPPVRPTAFRQNGRLPNRPTTPVPQVWKLRRTVIAVTPLRRISISERIQVGNEFSLRCAQQGALRVALSKIEGDYFLAKDGNVPAQTLHRGTFYFRSATPRDAAWHFDGRPRSFRELTTRLHSDGDFRPAWCEWWSQKVGNVGKIHQGDSSPAKEVAPPLADVLATLGKAIDAWHEAVADVLDPVVLHASRHDRETDLELYAFLKNAHWLDTGDPLVLKWRTQAAREMRTYVHDLVCRSQFTQIDFPLAVDRGEQLIPMLAEEYGVTRELVRWGRRAHHLSFPYGDDLFRSSLRVLGTLAPEKRPASIGDWNVFDFLRDEARKCQKALVAYNLPDAEFETATARLIQGMTRTGFSEALRRWQRRTAVTNGMADLPDCVAGVAAVLDAPATQDAMSNLHYVDTSVSTALDFWRSMLTAGYACIQEFNESWHRGVVEFSKAGLDRHPSDISWPPLAATWAIDGFEIRCLANAAAVIDDGRAMSHCVAIYVEACRTGMSHLFSLTTTSGDRLSTIEIWLNRDHERIVPALQQHRARFNAQPSLALQKIVSRWFDNHIAQIPQSQLASVLEASGALHGARAQGRSAAERIALARQSFALRYAWPKMLGSFER